MDQAAIYAEVLPMDIGRSVGSQEHHGLRDVLGRTKAAQRGLEPDRATNLQTTSHVDVGSSGARAMESVLMNLPHANRRRRDS